MKKVLSLLFACVTTLTAIADEGGARYPENWTYGNIYVKEPNQSIALEKEYMYVSGEKIEAVFCFRNTTDSTVVVPCAFPIVIKMPFNCGDENDTITLGDWHDVIDEELWNLALDNTVYVIDKNPGLYYATQDLSITKKELRKYDKQLRVLTFSEYQTLYDAKQKCNVIQDGNVIEMKNVGIETNVDFHEKNVLLVLHFYHELKFQPNTLSKVYVDYNVNGLKEAYEASEYEFYYDISTGGTWKDGIIGSFVLMTDYEMGDGDNRKPIQDLHQTRIIPYNVYNAKSYRPTGRFLFKGWDEHTNLSIGRHHTGVQNSYVRHFSLRKENNNYSINDETAKSFTPTYIDSVLTFIVRSYCIGPFVANGFVDTQNLKRNIKYFEYKYYWRDGEIPTMQRDSIWERNSRIKTATLSNIDEGWNETLQLDDRFPAYPYEVNSNVNDGWYGVNSVRNVKLLQPGKYKFEITDTYKGDSTTAIGVSHIWFYPVDATLVSIIDEDAHSEMPLFSDVWKKLLSIQLSDEKLMLGDIDLDKFEKEYDETHKSKEKSEPEEVYVFGSNKRKIAKQESNNESFEAMPIVIGVALLLLVSIVVLIYRKKRS